MLFEASCLLENMSPYFPHRMRRAAGIHAGITDGAQLTFSLSLCRNSRY